MSETIRHTMDTQPLILCGIILVIGIAMGVFLGTIARIVLRDPVPNPVKEECYVCDKHDHIETLITRVCTKTNAFL